ncbi:hypothetical protein COT62_03590 [Candidatus Roizmanbacteria bacterium CG09_land_8_20_14_0_10_41_9]|uniref:Uncharacterized protein n=1 Tax=Candidatus Roizmanbacteria bacterium CG09_land_8_20_14_0_10_41_9 TaxID=1974850 RepID=A0A2H0WS59_9BACT|nr:MAG: hypothetical protein COT62_03590 [Candidatus Roizmanbacteria bacterium CG09_land_8_20_14_0_10_41_9]
MEDGSGKKYKKCHYPN